MHDVPNRFRPPWGKHRRFRGRVEDIVLLINILQFEELIFENLVFPLKKPLHSFIFKDDFPAGVPNREWRTGAVQERKLLRDREIRVVFLRIHIQYVVTLGLRFWVELQVEGVDVVFEAFDLLRPLFFVFLGLRGLFYRLDLQNYLFFEILLSLEDQSENQRKRPGEEGRPELEPEEER